MREKEKERCKESFGGEGSAEQKTGREDQTHKIKPTGEARRQWSRSVEGPRRGEQRKMQAVFPLRRAVEGRRERGREREGEKRRNWKKITPHAFGLPLGRLSLFAAVSRPLPSPLKKRRGRARSGGGTGNGGGACARAREREREERGARRTTEKTTKRGDKRKSFCS